MVATPDSPREDTITVQSRSDVRHLLVLGGGSNGDGHDLEPSTPAADTEQAPLVPTGEVS